MKRAALLTLLPTALLAAPAEDHWSTPLSPADAKALKRAEVQIKVWNYAKAVEMLEPLAARLTTNADVHNLLGYAYRKTGALAKSGLAYERALYLNPNHLGALEYQGELFLTQGDVAAAEGNLAKLNALCEAGCEERDELAAAIAEWRAKAE